MTKSYQFVHEDLRPNKMKTCGGKIKSWFLKCVGLFQRGKIYIELFMLSEKKNLKYIILLGFNRPGVSGAVVQIPSWLIY